MVLVERGTVTEKLPRSLPFMYVVSVEVGVPGACIRSSAKAGAGITESRKTEKITGRAALPENIFFTKITGMRKHTPSPS